MIYGNEILIIQQKTVTENSLGEQVEAWKDVANIIGFLDLMSNQQNISTHFASIIESSHVFICDYKPIDVDVEICRGVIDGRIYDLKYIDDPMNLHKHLEIFLDYIGGQ